MPFTSFPGTISSSPGAVAPAAFQPSVYMAGPVWNAQPYLQVVVDGTQLIAVKSVDISMGLDISYATATVELYENPDFPGSAGQYMNSDVVIVAGTGPNNAQRFHGRCRRVRSNLWPHTYSLLCSGQLSLADKYKQSTGAAVPSFVNAKLPVVGLSVFDLMGQAVDMGDSNQIAGALPGISSTDENYISAVLSWVPELSFDPGDIGGTGHVFGTLAWRDLTWPPYVSALAQCRKLDEVCLGYRLFEGLDGRIQRRQVYGYPQGGSSFEYTEGIDVLMAIGERSIEDLYNGVYVEGYALGGLPGLINAYGAQGNDFQSPDSPVVETFTSSLIEDFEFAQAVRDWKLTEGNRQLVDIQLTTFRDDPLEPGQTIAVNLPHAAVTEPVWVQHVDIRIQAKPIMFRQVVHGKGGGLPG